MTDLELDQEDNLDTTTSETSETADEADEENSQQEQEKDSVDSKETRHAQQQEGAKKEVERVKGIAFDMAVRAAKADGNSLLELHEQDPKLARQVAKHFNYDSIDAVKSYLSSLAEGEEATPPAMSEEELNRWYEKRRKEEVHQESLKKAERLISKVADDDQRERAEAYFEKIVGNKKLTEDEALEFAEMATLYVSKDRLRGERKEEALAKVASTGLSTSKKSPKGEPQYDIDERSGELVLISN